MPTYKAVIFDLDGTLLNTLTDLANAVNYVLTKYGYQAQPQKQIRAFLGNGIERLCRLALPKGISEREFQSVFQDFKAYYTDHCHIATKPYDGIAEVLEALKQKGRLTAVVSNKNEAAVMALKQEFFPQISVVIGQSGAMRRKPAPDMVNAALEKLGVSAGEAVYVGDSEVDKATADNVGMDCILVTWGFRDPDVVEKLGANFVIHAPEELLKYV
jgi:phosphoglycolate phosphatase